MTTRYKVEHITTYRYFRPVSFGVHRLMFRPQAGHDIQVLDAEVDVNLRCHVDWVLDTQSNTVTVIEPLTTHDELRIACRFSIEHYDRGDASLPLTLEAQRWPFDYSVDERRDLGAMLEPHHPDPNGLLYEWMRPYLMSSTRPDTKDLLLSIARGIQSGFRYEQRDAEGTQTPHETLLRGAGSCRDYALLMMEAVRRLGMAARFVSGYLYDPALDTGIDEGVVGAGATHAWLQVYLPGAGWVTFDPTNANSVDSSLIRVAYARDPSLAAPLTGSWTGAPSDFAGMQVKVSVRRLYER